MKLVSQSGSSNFCPELRKNALLISQSHFSNFALHVITFEIDCFYGLWTRIYEYRPTQLPISRGPWLIRGKIGCDLAISKQPVAMLMKYFTALRVICPCYDYKCSVPWSQSQIGNHIKGSTFVTFNMGLQPFWQLSTVWTIMHAILQTQNLLLCRWRQHCS